MLGKQSAPRLCGCGTRSPYYALSLLLPPSPPPSPASCVSLLSHCCDLVTPLVRCSCSCLNTWVAGCLTAAGASGELGGRGGGLVWAGTTLFSPILPDPRPLSPPFHPYHSLILFPLPSSPLLLTSVFARRQPRPRISPLPIVPLPFSPSAFFPLPISHTLSLNTHLYIHPSIIPLPA